MARMRGWGGSLFGLENARDTDVPVWREWPSDAPYAGGTGAGGGGGRK